MNYLLYYNTNTGAGAVGQIDELGNHTTLKSYAEGSSLKGWTHIAATEDHFLYYNTNTGAGAVGQIDTAGNHTTLKSYSEGSFSKGWTHIAATKDHFLTYNINTGAGGTGRIDESGNFITLKSYSEGSLSKGWTHIAATKDHLLYYNTNTGTGAIGRIDDLGNHITLKSYSEGFSTGWTHIAATDEHFLTYNINTGAGGTGRIDESGNFITLKSYPEGSFSTWTHIAATENHFLSYHIDRGAGGTGQIDAAGNFITLKSYSERDFATGWTHINTSYWHRSIVRILMTSNRNFIYAVMPNGKLRWWKHTGYQTGANTWEGGNDLGEGWNEAKHVFSMGNGIIYAVLPNGKLRWWKHTGYQTGANTWEGGNQFGEGWNEAKHVFSMGNGIIYAVLPNGKLIWWKHTGYQTGADTWEGGNQFGEGWDSALQVFTPSVFTPSVFTPSVFTPSVFTPSVFTPSVFTPSAMMTIQEKWLALGGSQSFLGNPVTDELGCPDGVGRFRHYKKREIEGSIYWTPSTGAQVVFGAIRHRWAALGWEKSFLGYPVTDESICPDGVGRYNHFQGGSIYWTPATGAHLVYGDIRNKWAALGWEKSPLGYPLSDEMDTFDGQFRFNQFQNGTITWRKSNGEINVNRNCIAQIVIDEIRADWTTERKPWNDRDEAYFVLNGGIGSNTGYRPVNGGKISPPPPEDYFQFWNETVINNIGLTEVSLNAGESALVTVVLREQDNAQLPAIKEAVVAAAAGVAAYFGAPTADIAKDKAKSAAIQFYESLKQDGHQNIGGFSVRIVYRDGQRKVEWISGSATELIHQDGSTAVFKATDSDAQYIIRLSVK
jgi:hypothetical protein